MGLLEQDTALLFHLCTRYYGELQRRDSICDDDMGYVTNWISERSDLRSNISSQISVILLEDNKWWFWIEKKEKFVSFLVEQAV